MRIPKHLPTKILIYLYSFIVIYMPRITDLYIGISVEVLSVLILFIMFIPWLLLKFRKNHELSINKNVAILIAGIVLSATFFAVRASVASNELRIFQNLFILVQITHLAIIIDLMKLAGYNLEGMLKVVLNLGLIQGIITIIMLILPGFREIALNLYYLNREENIFITRMRIYGISGDYTYFTPIYHGFLASVAFFYAILSKKKYLLYIPFLLITILLNGRFGLVIFMLSLPVTFVYMILKGKISMRLIRFSIIIVFFIFLGLLTLSIISPFTYNWIIAGVEDTINFFVNQDKTGTYASIADTMFYRPTGVSMIWGEGHRVYSEHGLSRGYIASDIGYVNDLFMGGLIYVFILYGSIFNFLAKGVQRQKNKNGYDVYKIISFFSILVLLLSNYKGESMRGGTILLGVIFLKMILMCGHNE